MHQICNIEFDDCINIKFNFIILLMFFILHFYTILYRKFDYIINKYITCQAH